MKKNLKSAAIILLIGIACTICFTSCSSDDDQTTQIQEDNFYALKVGNSWVYKTYRFNHETGNYEFRGNIDSVSIVGTEVVNDNQYFKFRYNMGKTDFDGNPIESIHFTLLRDSLGYLVRDDGKIINTNNDFNERISREAFPFGVYYEKLQENSDIVNVEAGTFDCLNTKRYFIDNDGLLSPGFDHIYYSKGVGLVLITWSIFLSDTPSAETRLDSYNVQ